jgi:hypothetical protein
MRLAFFILLLVNLILLAWGQGYLGTTQGEREPERLQRQLDPAKLRIVNSETTAPQLPPPATASRPMACKRIAWLSAAEAGAIRDAVSALPDWNVSQIARKEDPTYWVVIPALASRTLAEKKKGELGQLGVKESEVVEDANFGPFAVSLGVFRGQANAEDYLQSSTRKGVRSAQVIKRETATEKFAIDLRAPTELLAGKLPELMTVLPQAILADCPAQ